MLIVPIWYMSEAWFSSASSRQMFRPSIFQYPGFEFNCRSIKHRALFRGERKYFMKIIYPLTVGCCSFISRCCIRAELFFFFNVYTLLYLYNMNSYIYISRLLLIMRLEWLCYVEPDWMMAVSMGTFLSSSPIILIKLLIFYMEYVCM